MPKSSKSSDPQSGLLVSPLYSPGVGHAGVHAPHVGEIPDPLGLVDANRPAVGWTDVGGGDDVQVWSAQSPYDGDSSGRR